MNKNQHPPLRSEAFVFRTKTIVLQTARGARNLFDGKLNRFLVSDKLQSVPIRAESKTLLWTEKDSAEQFLTAGKIHNLRIAAARLNGIEIPAGETFSFWKHIGKTTRARGFVAGRELREGCIIPNVGGGLCQLSNALYDAALQANFEIVERHAHTQIVRGSLAEKGRDATVFWNYVDLRFKSQNAFRIEAKLDAENLIVRFRSEKQIVNNSIAANNLTSVKLQPSNHLQNCATCRVNDCFRVIKPTENLNFGRAAFLLDEFSPEFDEYIQDHKFARDVLLIPLDGARFGKANYYWTTGGFAEIKQSFSVTVQRSYKSRKLSAQGAARQLNLLAMSEKLAKSYAKNLSFDVLHIVAHQNLLPFLWRAGVLGGRTFDVLMTALPLENLQHRLDFAKSLHPESIPLGDFRAAHWLIQAETEALKNARKIITPHTEIAALFPEKAEVLDWKIPSAKDLEKIKNEKLTIAFPAATVGRKGVYELREAVRGLDVKIILSDAEIEDKNFWQGFDVERGKASEDWLNKADLVVLPAFVEHNPRRLLQSVAARIPVVASKACGLENVKGVETIENGDTEILREMIQRNLFTQENNRKNSARRKILT